VTPAEWKAFPQVQGDLFESVTLPADYQEELSEFVETGVELFA
jgi:hypothetical protein